MSNGEKVPGGHWWDAEGAARKAELARRERGKTPPPRDDYEEKLQHTQIAGTVANVEALRNAQIERELPEKREESRAALRELLGQLGVLEKEVAEATEIRRVQDEARRANEELGMAPELAARTPPEVPYTPGDAAEAQQALMEQINGEGAIASDTGEEEPPPAPVIPFPPRTFPAARGASGHVSRLDQARVRVPAGTREVAQEEPPVERVVVMLGARMEKPSDDPWTSDYTTQKIPPGHKGIWRTLMPEIAERARKWRFPLFTREATNVRTSLPGEVSGGWSRMRALEVIKKMLKKNEHLTVLVTGGNEKSGHSRAENAAKRLVEKYGLAENEVVPLSSAGQTIGNSERVAQYVEDTPTLKDVSEVEIVTNDYHMLRAWIMFSAAMLKKQSGGKEIGKDIIVPDSEKQAIREILDRGLANPDPASVAETRKKVMQALEKYFGGNTIQIKPRVVEDTIDEMPTKYRSEYTRRLRNDKMVRATLEWEYKGVMDLINGNYQRL